MPAKLDLCIQSLLFGFIILLNAMQCNGNALLTNVQMNENQPNVDFMDLQIHVAPANLYSQYFSCHML